MKKILSLILILLGGWLVYVGYNRGESLAGKTKSGIAELKNEIDGKMRVPDHVWYYVGGGALIVAGAVVAARRS
jgi:hypothetical protein